MHSTIRSLAILSRSTRRFDESRRIPHEVLVGLVDTTRFCPSARNRQPLRYIISSEPGETTALRSCLLWALDLPDWGGPTEGERPVAYITMLADRNTVPDPAHDAGIAAQTIMLAAAEQGIAGCIFGSILRGELQGMLAIPADYEILLVLALGYSAETVMLEELEPGGDTRYWRDDNGVHHVPKRTLKEILLRG